MNRKCSTPNLGQACVKGLANNDLITGKLELLQQCHCVNCLL